MEEFITNMVSSLEIEQEVNENTRLEDIIEWDSVGIVSFLAMVNVEYGKTLRVADVSGVENLKELYDIVMGK